MNRHTGGIILFIIINCLPNLCTAAAYGETCADTNACTGSYQECDTDNKCSCTSGFTVNGNVCNADLGTDCSNGESCHDQFAECVGTPAKCSCKNTHYDDDGDVNGGTCQLKKSLGEECPNPSTVPSACSIMNSECSSDASSSTNYKCKCVSQYMEQTGTCVEVTWSDWTNWGNCDVSCGSGTRTRTGTCPVIGSCTGDGTESEQCTSGDCPVAVDGIWGDWSPWSACSCGDSIVQQTRSRICNNPPASNGGQDCVGSSSDTQQCAITACPVDGIWGDWTPWSACSPTCGDSNGSQNRSRICDSPAPSNGGKHCVGSNSDTQQCTISKCPVDGGLSEWLQWSSCTVSCAGGSRTRNRTCTNPTPQYDGKDCTGDLAETQTCNSGVCPEVEFGQTCTMNGDKCKGTFTDCIGGTCKCISGYFRNGNECEPKIELGSSGCSTSVSDSCKSPDATCRSNGGSCTCNGGYYDDNGGQAGGTCTKKIELGSYGCSTTVTNSCKSPNAECQSNRYCRCNSGYYDDNGSWAGGTCTRKIELGSSGCSNTVSDSCKSPYAKCQLSGYCTCNGGYYDDNGNQAGGTCTRKIELGSSGCSTTVTDSCKSPDATCQTHGGSCKCNNGYFDDNGSGAGGGTCRQKIELGSSGCSTAVSDSCRSPNAACQSHGGSCKCINGYYDDNGSLAGGTCIQRKDLGAQCSNITNECADANAACLDDKCTCGLFYYDDNGFNPGGSCESVSGLKVISIGFQSVTTSGFTVSWTPPSGVKASHINNYEVEWSLKISDNSLAGGNRLVPAGTTSFDISTGVTAGKTYNVKVISVNTNTRKDHPRTSFLTSEKASKPNKPRLLTTLDLDATDQRITIGWSAPSSGVATSYRVQLFDGTSQLTSNDFIQTSGSIYYQKMKNGYHYDVKISARSELYQGRQGSNYEWSDFYVEQITTTVQVPNPPTEVKCDMLKDESITLKWLKPLVPNGDLVRFNIEVFNTSNDLLNSTNTAEVVETHQVMELSPGTTYMFKVYTENVMYNSSVPAQSPYCTTKAKLSDPPDGFQTTEVRSRNISIKWTEPINSYSEEIYGYVIQLKNQDTCVEEIVYKCLKPSCRATFEPSTLEHMCDSNVRKLFRVNKPELIGSKSYQFLNLLPDTTYTITGAAVNNLGTGNTVDIVITTEEEAPQVPYNVEVNEMKTTSFKVTWNIDDPRPGKTNYTVKLMADHPAESKQVILTGFNIREYVAENLQEYWNYSVLVTATTSKGFKTSTETIKYRTLPTAPGKVSNFVLKTSPGGNYTRMKISWQAPDILLQNSVIKSYSFMYFQDQKIESRHSKSFEHELSQSHNYELFVDVIPEETYTFEVNAINEQNETGEKNSETKTAPAGVPINIAKTQNITLIPSDEVKNVGETRMTVSIVKEFFLEETYGKVQGRGLFVCPKKDCSLKDTVTMLADFDRMDSWKENKESYRVTNKTWFDDLEKSQTKSRRRRSVTELEYNVGVEDCSKPSTDKYCNGPLQPGSTYYIFCVSCTSGGCLVSDGNGPFITKAVPDEEANLGLIIGLVVAGVVIIVLIAVIAVLLLRRKRRHGDGMKPSPGEDDDDVFTKLDPATANIKRKRPINLNDIEEYVGNMHKDSNLLFSAEYEELKTLSPKHACEAADREENRMRNRYINIIPFDHSRVKLSTNGEDDSADYINGNYLPGYNSPREYIGCQGPIPGTIDDFWRMTWEQNVSVIVMLTLCKEGQKIKCEQYWPDEVGEPKQYGDVIVEITSYSNIRTYDYRMFRITNGSTTRVVKHFHFLSWLDFQANVHHDIILDFIQHVRQHVQPPDTSGPMIIHCSAGVGRTGTYIALDHLMQFINEHDFDVEIDIFDLVLKLRENRQHMVQTEQQYVFIHDCVKEIMERKRRQMENIYENQGFSQDENIYQNEQSLYANVSISKAEQNTEL